MTLQEYFNEYSCFPSCVRIYNDEGKLIARGSLIFRSSKKDCIEIMLSDGNDAELPLSLACEDQGDGRVRAILNDKKVFLHFVF
jgi:hypothetical protein